jgi:putative Mg2+ transporter-C (MgtC) family protein
MSPELHWQGILLRLVLTIVAGGLLGVERSRTGHSAGLRTTLLVTLAASIAMIQMNLLMQTNGKPPNSYAVMDLMRLPLGILTGVGFIGAGAIVRKGDVVVGITTAATMWFATVVGLCLGGGQVILGSVSTVIGLGVLRGMTGVESMIEKYQSAELRLTISGDNLSAEELRAQVETADFQVQSVAVKHLFSKQQTTFDCQVRWPAGQRGKADIPPAVHRLEALPGLLRLEWNRQSITDSRKV